MKRIIYFAFNKDEEALITEKEFIEYRKKIEMGNSYWCERLEVSLPSKPKIINTPKDEVGYEVFLELNEDNSIKHKWLTRKKRWFRNVSYGGDPVRQEFTGSYMDGKLKKNNFIPQEEYYTNKMYLN